MIKKMKEVIPGDIIRVEYGDYDNWIAMIVDHVFHYPNQYCGCNIEGRCQDGKFESIWGIFDEDIEVIEEQQYHGIN